MNDKRCLLFMLTHDSELRNVRSALDCALPSEGLPPACTVRTPEEPSANTELIRICALGNSRYGSLSLVLRDSPSDVVVKITDLRYVECCTCIDPEYELD